MSKTTRHKRTRNPGALARHWRLATGVTVILALAAVVGVMLMPRRYQSEARLMVHEPEPSIAAIIEALTSQAMLERLAQSLDEPQTLAQLERNIDVVPGDTTNILSLQCRADTSTSAQQTSSRLVELCLEAYAGHAPTAVSDSATGKPPADAGRAQLHDELTGVLELLETNRAELERAETRVADLEQRLAAMPEDLPPPAPPAASPVSDLKAKLLELEAQERDLAATHSELHPLLRAVREQVADLQRVIGEQPTLPGPAASAVASPRQSLEAELREAQSKAKALRTRQQSLAALEAKLQSELQDENIAHAPPALAPPPEPTTIARTPGTAISLTLMQPASIPIELTGPRRLQVLALGLLVALAGGFGSAFVAAFFRPVLNTPADLERLLEVPLVGVLPRSKGPATAGVS